MGATVRVEANFRLPYSRPAVWSILSKTDWLNRALGLPPVNYDVTPLPEGGSATLARARFHGMELRWKEMPFEWMEGEFYEVHRVFEGGPFLEARMGAKFEDDQTRGIKLHVYSHLTSRHYLGKIGARYLFAPKVRRDFEAIISHIGEHLDGNKADSFPNLLKTPSAEATLTAGLAKLRGAIADPQAVAAAGTVCS